MSLLDGERSDLFSNEIEQTEAEIAAKQARLEAMRSTQTEAQNCMGQLQQLATTVEGLSPSALQAFKKNVMKLFGVDDEPPDGGSRKSKVQERKSEGNGHSLSGGRGFKDANDLHKCGVESQSSSSLSTFAVSLSTFERNKLVIENLNLVRRIAHDFTGCCLETYHDLEQVGTIGLIKAVERYNPERNSKLSTFAVPYIRGAILHHLRDLGHLIKIPRAWQEKYNTVMRRHREEGITPTVIAKRTPEAIALSLNIKDWHEIEQAMGGFVGELNENTTQELADSLDMFDQVETENLHACLQQLSLEEQLAIQAVWFEEMTPRKAASYVKSGLSSIIDDKTGLGTFVNVKVSFGKLQELCQSGLEKLKKMLLTSDFRLPTSIVSQL